MIHSIRADWDRCVGTILCVCKSTPNDSSMFASSLAVARCCRNLFCSPIARYFSCLICCPAGVLSVLQSCRCILLMTLTCFWTAAAFVISMISDQSVFSQCMLFLSQVNTSFFCPKRTRPIIHYTYFFCILLTCLCIRSKIFQQAYTDGVGVLLLEAEKVGNHCTSVLMQAQKAAAGFTTVCLCS